MIFQHYSCSVDSEKSLLTLYGRNDSGSVALHTKLKPYLVCSADPRYYFDLKEGMRVTSVKGNNIVSWGERVFYKLYFESVIQFYMHRKKLRERGVQMFNDQVGLDSQWFVSNDVRPGDAFVVVVNKFKGKRTTCDAEYFLRNITPVKENTYIPPLVLSYDIECLLRPNVFPDPKVDPIITIGCYSSKESKCFCLKETPGFESFETEKEMIKAFLRYVYETSPDFITGYNINRFDNTYLEARCSLLGVPFVWSRLKRYPSTIKHITTHSNQRGTQEQYRMDMPGVVVMDGYEIMRAQHNEAKYSLEAVCQKYLGTGKDDMPYHLIPEKFKTPEGRRELAVYCVKDCKLVIDLFDKLKKVVNLLQMAKVTGCFPTDIIYRGQGIRTITLMLIYCKDKNIFIPRGDKSCDGFEGAVVLPPKPGFYRDPVAVVDFASLYPSIMRACNMCYSTIVSREEIERHGWVEGEDVITIPDYEWVNGRLRINHNPNNVSFVTSKIRQGILPLMLATLHAERKRVKKAMKKHYGTSMESVLDGKQLAIKVVMNSIYGFTGAKKGFLPEPKIASSVTKYGRGLTLRTMDSVNNNPKWKGSEVVYGDSVSSDTPLFVRINGAFDIVPISSLANGYKRSRDKEFCELENVEVWSDKGWTRVHRVIRHAVVKKMYRVSTETSFVDVTEDHSMLRGDGTPVKPTDCTRDLLEVPFPDVEESECPLTYLQAWWWGVSLGSRTNAYGVEYTEWKIPTFVLMAPKRVLCGFFDGLSSTAKGSEKMRRIMRYSEHALRCQYLLHRLGIRSSINLHSEGTRVCFRKNKAKKRFSVTQLDTKEQYVYDLTTDNHHFHAGVGHLVVHNTDSCFIRLSREFCDADNRDDLISKAHVKGEEMAADITKMFLHPVLMEYETALYPLILYRRKRYAAVKYEPGKSAKIYIKGFECIRRDFCALVIKSQYRMFELLLDHKIDEAVAYVQGVMRDLYAGKIHIDDLALSKKLSQKPENYKTTAPHVELALRLKGKYQAGERVEYWIRAGREPLNKRAITREELSEYPLDFEYYAKKQLWNPLQRVMDLVVGRDVFSRRAVTASIRQGSLLKYVKVGERRKKRKIERTNKPTLTDADIRSFFG